MVLGQDHDPARGGRSLCKVRKQYQRFHWTYSLCFIDPTSNGMIIHLTGPDTYRSRARMHQLRDAFLAKHDQRGYNTVVLDGLTATKSEIRAALTSGGLFATKTFVAINGYEAAGSACAAADLLTALEPVTETKDVVAVVREVSKAATEKKPGRGKKSAGPKAELQIPGAKHEPFPLMTPVESKTWLTKEAKLRGGALSTGVAEQLAAATENDSWRLGNELEKVLAYAGPRPVTTDDVSTMVISPASSDIFGLTDAIGGRQRARALHLLQQELASGVHPLALIAMIARHIRTLRQVQRAVEEGVARTHIATELGLHPFVVQKALEQSKKFTADTLRQWHRQLVETDFQLKSTPLGAEAMLDVLVAGA